jgi:DNA transformation protein and related proteins
MSVNFTDYLHDVFSRFAPIQIKRMFGGHGLFRDGLMFGLVADDTLYLKADGQSLEHFQALGLGPFEYQRLGTVARLAYYRAPEAVLEDRDEARLWGMRAFEAALRAQANKGRRSAPNQAGR